MTNKEELGLPWVKCEHNWSDTSLYSHKDTRCIFTLSIRDYATEDNQEVLERFMDNQANFILTACNNHHALVEALEKCLDDLDAMPMSLGFKYTSTREAHEVLKKVKEQDNDK